MKTLFTSFAALILGATALFAQVGEQKPDRPFYIAVQGGPLYSVNENTFTYYDNNRGSDLFTWQGSFSVGYDFGKRAGARLNVSYGNNASAANFYQTYGSTYPNPENGKYYFPYEFKNISAFLDITWNIAAQGSEGAFVPKVYAGVGYARTMNFTESNHYWQYQYIYDGNNSFGFRFGFIGEVKFSDAFGAFIDICGEAYTDHYNGLRPGDKEQSYLDKGYLGFPLDLRGLASFGLAIHF